MLRTTAFSLALAALLVPASARATEEGVQFWTFLVVTAPVADKVTATIEVSPRLREGPDQIFNCAALDVAVAEGLSVGASIVYVEFAGGHEIRPQQQITYANGPLSLRTMLEERFFEGSDRALIRLRQQARLAFPLDDKTQISGGGELLYILRDDTPGDEARVDQWRVEVALRRRIAAELDVALAYRGIYVPREGAEDRFDHVPVLTLTWRL